MFDFHIHIARLPHSKQLTQLLLDRNYDFIAIACEPWEWRIVSKLKKEFSSEIKPFKTAYGIHPMIATQVNDETFSKLRKILKDDELAMVGEAGIDKRYPGYDNGVQDHIFLEQAKLAIEFKRDLQIHCVGDYQRILRLLTKAGFTQSKEPKQNAVSLETPLPEAHFLDYTKHEMPRPCFHRFGGDESFVKMALPYGSLFSLHADSFRKKSTAAAIPQIPQERVLFETDADETFLDSRRSLSQPPSRDGNDDKSAENAVLSNARDTLTNTATVDPGTGSGVTNESNAGGTSKSAESDDNVILTLAEGKDPETFSPEEILTELESRLESVRAAYTKCRE